MYAEEQHRCKIDRRSGVTAPKLVALSFKSEAEVRCEVLFCERSFHLSLAVLKLIFAHTQSDQSLMLLFE